MQSSAQRSEIWGWLSEEAGYAGSLVTIGFIAVAGIVTHMRGPFPTYDSAVWWTYALILVGYGLILIAATQTSNRHLAIPLTLALMGAAAAAVHPTIFWWRMNRRYGLVAWTAVPALAAIISASGTCIVLACAHHVSMSRPRPQHPRFARALTRITFAVVALIVTLAPLTVFPTSTLSGYSGDLRDGSVEAPPIVGRVTWSALIEERMISAVATAWGPLIASPKGLTAIDSSNGSIRWTYKRAGGVHNFARYVQSPLLASPNGRYVTTYFGDYPLFEAVVFDAQTGKITARHTITPDTRSTGFIPQMRISDNVAWLHDTGVDTRTGKTLWRQTAPAYEGQHSGHHSFISDTECEDVDRGSLCTFTIANDVDLSRTHELTNVRSGAVFADGWLLREPDPDGDPNVLEAINMDTLESWPLGTWASFGSPQCRRVIQLFPELPERNLPDSYVTGFADPLTRQITSLDQFQGVPSDGGYEAPLKRWWEWGSSWASPDTAGVAAGMSGDDPTVVVGRRDGSAPIEIRLTAPSTTTPDDAGAVPMEGGIAVLAVFRGANGSGFTEVTGVV